MSKEYAEKLLERNRVGVLMRIFAATPEEVDGQIESALIALRKLLSLKTGPRATFARIDFLVSSDQDFEDSDCGLTAEKLRSLISEEFPDAPVQVFDIKKGDIYAMLLNYGVATHLEDRTPYSLILSHRAHEHITEQNIHTLFAAMHNKARVAGLALPEIAESVREGRIANTFALWHNKSLMTIGGFDLRAGKPLRSYAEQATTVTGFNAVYEEKYGNGAVTYHTAGCEEIIPLLRFVTFFGKSIKVIIPEETGASMPQEAGMQRHLSKLGTKDARQKHMAALTDYDIAILKEGLIE